MVSLNPNNTAYDIRTAARPIPTLATPTRITTSEKLPLGAFRIFLARKLLKLMVLVLLISCKINANDGNLLVGAERMDEYVQDLKSKRVGLVVNHTSLVHKTHLLDTLLQRGIEVTAIFAPEHGFRGEASAGDIIKDGKDVKTGLPVYSLYGKTKKPSPKYLENIDILLFDIQDVGVRFYTYSSTLHYVLEAAGENNKEVLILDRPNPNGHYVAGPVLEKEFASFVGLNPIPVVHGLTMGEYANMILGENWIAEKPKLKVVLCENYTHSTFYSLPIKPSPNLPNDQSILLYPSLCLLEPTAISVGRGTNMQFQVLGGPERQLGSFSFIPIDMPGAINPVNENKTCYGIDLRKVDAQELGFTLKYLIDFYTRFQEKSAFFSNQNFFYLLMGNKWVWQEIERGTSEKEITAMWAEDLEAYKIKRTKYLFYPE